MSIFEKLADLKGDKLNCPGNPRVTLEGQDAFDAVYRAGWFGYAEIYAKGLEGIAPTLPDWIKHGCPFLEPVYWLACADACNFLHGITLEKSDARDKAFGNGFTAGYETGKEEGTEAGHD